MGDVIGITDSAGSLIATYTCGAWGEVLATTPATAGNASQLAIANANPLRYRGYYLDQETGYYYLQSRYYNPISTRFINADKGEIASISKDYVSGNNLFVYCNNGSVNSSD
ncbi:MAG: RHS repeat-associated core domain-containing protein, partial [Clostridia bacterium]|nr:RHS repeat-associated core domain-containing protein [Clostridia bacterium]